jgi:hypothetical protein
MADDPYLPLRRPAAVVREVQKRRRLESGRDSYDKQRYESVEESRRGEEGDGYGSDRNDYRPVRPVSRRSFALRIEADSYP